MCQLLDSGQIWAITKTHILLDDLMTATVREQANILVRLLNQIIN